MSRDTLIQTKKNICKGTTLKGKRCKQWSILGGSLCIAHEKKYQQLARGDRCTYIKSNKKRCLNSAMNGYERCRKHGAEKGLGLASPSYITGQNSRYGDYLSRTMKDDYLIARLDPNLLNFADDVALLESLQKDALLRSQRGESEKTWKDALKLFKKVKEAERRQDEAGYRGFSKELESLLTSNVAKYAAQKEAVDLTMKKVKIANEERKRRVEVGQLILLSTVHDKMITLLEGIKAALEKHTDSKTGRRVLMDSQDVLKKVFEAKT